MKLKIVPRDRPLCSRGSDKKCCAFLGTPRVLFRLLVAGDFLFLVLSLVHLFTVFACDIMSNTIPQRDLGQVTTRPCIASPNSRLRDGDCATERLQTLRLFVRKKLQD